MKLLLSEDAIKKTGKVVADLKLALWSSLFTARHEELLWKDAIRKVFPNSPKQLSVTEFRTEIRHSIERMWLFRNRIAHHEPIFESPIRAELNSMLQLVRSRSLKTYEWVSKIEGVSQLIQISSHQV